MKRVKRYAQGGLATPFEVSPSAGVTDPRDVGQAPAASPGGGMTGPTTAGSTNTAFGGLSQIDAGSQAAKGALQSAAQSIGSSSGTDKPAFKKGGMVGAASRRADGIAQRGKTRGRYL